MKYFDGFGGFATFLAGLTAVAVVDSVNHELLERSAVLIEDTAKKKLGDYQAAAGPFGAWAPLAEETKDDRVRQGYTPDDPGLRSGAMQASIEHNSNAHEAHVGSNDDNMVFFELGTSKQPPRSTLGGAAFEKAHEVVELIGEGMLLHLEGNGVPRGKMLIE